MTDNELDRERGHHGAEPEQAHTPTDDEREAARRLLGGVNPKHRPASTSLLADDIRIVASAVLRRRTWEPDPMSHDFLPVAGHPDDDECTDREDGTDATYCGLPEAAHSIAEQCEACDTPLEDCPMPVAGCCDDCTHAANYGSTDREDGSRDA